MNSKGTLFQIFLKWRYPIISSLVVIGILSVYLNFTNVSNSVQVIERRCKIAIPGKSFSMTDSRATCQSYAIALLFNRRSEFHRLFKRYYTYSTSSYDSFMKDDSVLMKVSYDNVTVAERGPNVYISDDIKTWIFSDKCTDFRFFNTRLFCFNQVVDAEKGKIIKKTGLHYMIPVLTTLKYTNTSVANALVQSHTGASSVNSYNYTYANNTFYTDATNPILLGYMRKTTSSETRYGIQFRYGDPTSCNLQIDTQYAGAANFKQMPPELWPTRFTPNANGKFDVVFVCPHTINQGNAIGQADIYKNEFKRRISDAAIMYHEALHTFEGHQGCDNNNAYGSGVGNGKDRDFNTVYGAHINLNFALSESPYLNCEEKRYIFGIGRRELHGNPNPNTPHEFVGSKLCAGLELNARTSNGGLIYPSHYLENSYPNCD